MNYIELKTEKKKYYNSIKEIYSEALEANIYFNAKGFNHITFKNPRNIRTVPEQISRLKIFDTAVKLLKLANIYQEYEEVENLDTKKTTYYWGIIAIIDNIKIKVILRKIGNGQTHFWSVIPGYTSSEKRDQKFKIKGDPESD